MQDEFDEDGNWICPECLNEGEPGRACSLCGTVGSD